MFLFDKICKVWYSNFIMFLKSIISFVLIFFFSCALPYNYEYVTDTFNGENGSSDEGGDSGDDGTFTEIISQESTCLEHETYNFATGACDCETGYARNEEGICALNTDAGGGILPVDGKCPDGYILNLSYCIIEDPVTCDAGFIPTPDGDCICPDGFYINANDECVVIENATLGGAAWEISHMIEPIDPIFELDSFKIYNNANEFTFCKSLKTNQTATIEHFKILCRKNDGVIINSSEFIISDGNYIDLNYEYTEDLIKLGVLYKLNNYSHLNFKFFENTPQGTTITLGATPFSVLYNQNFDYKLKRDLDANIVESAYKLEIANHQNNLIELFSSLNSGTSNTINLPNFSELSSVFFGIQYYFNYFDGTNYIFNKDQGSFSFLETDIKPVGGFYMDANNSDKVTFNYFAFDTPNYYIKKYDTDTSQTSKLLKFVDLTNTTDVSKVIYDSYYYDLGQVLKVALIINNDKNISLYLFSGTDSPSGNEGVLVEDNVFLNQIQIFEDATIKLKITNENKFLIIYSNNNEIHRIVFNKN